MIAHSTDSPALADRIGDVRVHALRLLDLQLWCWGCDVRTADRNFLRAYGCERRQPPARGVGGSEYAWQGADGLRVTLWGYGVHVTRPAESGLFLRRFGFSPRWTAPGYVPHGCWHVQSWKKARAPRSLDEQAASLTRLHDLCAWIAAYETWLASQAESAWRMHCLGKWHKEAVVPADALIKAWLRLADHFN